MGKLNTDFQRIKKELASLRKREDATTNFGDTEKSKLSEVKGEPESRPQRSVYTTLAIVISTMVIVYVLASCLSAIINLEQLDADVFQRVLFYGEIYVWWNLSLAILMTAVINHDNLR